MGFKYSVNKTFFDSWNARMAYVLGFIYADGNIHKSSRGHYLVITSTDKFIIENIKYWLAAEHPIHDLESTWRNGKMRFELRIGDKHIYQSLVQNGVYPNKSLTVRMPDVPNKFLADFVRGYFDGDGCVYLYRSPGKTKELIIRKLSVIFTSGSRKFLLDLLTMLRERMPDMRQSNVYKGTRSHQLRLSTKDSIAMFSFMYAPAKEGLFFKRKFAIFQRYFDLRPGQIDKKAKSILQSLRHGHVAN